MNTFTKILIVAVALINVAVSVVFIQMANYSANYREALDSAQARITAAETAATVARGQASRATTQFTELQNAMTTQLLAQDTQLKDAQATVINQKAEIARQKNLLESLNAKLAGLEGSVAQQVQLNEQYSAQLAKRIEEVQQLNGQLRSETMRRQELARDLQSSRQHAQVNHVRLLAAEDKIQELTDKLSKGGATADATEVAPRPAVEINAEIVRVVPEHGAAQINAGSSSGVQTGMKFIIYRGADYIGDFTVAEVEPDNSSGLLSTVQRQPVSGDKVTTAN